MWEISKLSVWFSEQNKNNLKSHDTVPSSNSTPMPQYCTYPLAKNALFENDRKEKLYICNVYFISICYIMCVSK